jgi:hypothetical protein
MRGGFMKLTAVGILILNLFFGLASFAQEVAPEFRGTSEANRNDKQHSFLFQVVGTGPAYVQTAQLQYAYFIDRNSQIQLEVGKGNQRWIEFLDHEDISMTNFGVQFKHFVSSSFYFKTGIDYFNLDFKHYNFWSSANSDFFQFKGSGTFASFSIGNQWQFRNFTLGCDWAGVTLPISSNVTSETLGGTTYNQGDLDDYEKRYFRESILELARLYIGFSF